MTPDRSRRHLAVLAVALIFAFAAVEGAEARRAGGFGSRGMRTYQAPRATFAAPRPAAPIQRSMTPPGQTARPAATAAAQRPAPANAAGAAQAQRGGFLRRWGGPILGGLMVAGLLGMLMGHGFGGAAGLMALLVQLGVVALVIGAAVWLFRRRAAPAAAGAGANVSRFEFQPPAQPAAQPAAAPARVDPAGAPSHDGDELGLGQGDLNAFEQLLGEVQTAFGREDYAALRERTTPEVMSYMAEELSRNAVAGRRNDVSDVRLLQGDVSEAWREDERDYATVAMRYASIDILRDRTTGEVVEGDPAQPTETVELWTFVRDRAGPWGAGWKLSAVQELEPEVA